MSEYGFTLSGVGLPEGEDPLGLWSVPPDDIVSFSAGAAVPPEEPTWRIELPESPEEAQAILAGQIQASELANKDLASVNRDLTHIGRTEAVSFSTADPLLAQKTELLGTLDAFQSPVSYGLFSRKDKKKESQDQESYQQWLAFVERVQRTVANYARIETAMAGQDVGWTAVGWTGNFTTTWEADVTRGMMRTHRQSVHLALGARIALIRIVSVVATGATGLAVKASIPGGQVLLLPAIWKFVRDVLAELRQSWPKLTHLG
ncbi:MAG: hypothetical protein GY832_23345 [Chloroflexi bacterium]|nr:hypothetical protein [Chloroflexota bacterium]